MTSRTCNLKNYTPWGIKISKMTQDHITYDTLLASRQRMKGGKAAGRRPVRRLLQ